MPRIPVGFIGEQAHLCDGRVVTFRNDPIRRDPVLFDRHLDPRFAHGVMWKALVAMWAQRARIDYLPLLEPRSTLSPTHELIYNTELRKPRAILTHRSGGGEPDGSAEDRAAAARPTRRIGIAYAGT